MAPAICRGIWRLNFRLLLTDAIRTIFPMSTPDSTPAPSLPSAGIFKVLDDQHRERLAAEGKLRLLAPGANLVTQGEIQDSLYFILEGSLNVTCHSPMSTVSMGTVKAGETVGEMNVLDPLKASATVRVQQTARVWEISREKFDAFCQTYPRAGVAILQEIARLLTKRIRRASDKLIRQAELAVAVYELD
jgi:CRP/FNR family transcriptional regulator, cyclic AMP receptor protein